MGFFSWNCRGCGHPLLSSHATNSINAWMQKAVALAADGSTAVGIYDGYGRIDDTQLVDWRTLDVWHEACWKKAGRPGYAGQADGSPDQGYFFDDPDHDMREPK